MSKKARRNTSPDSYSVIYHQLDDMDESVDGKGAGTPFSFIAVPYEMRNMIRDIVRDLLLVDKNSSRYKLTACINVNNELQTDMKFNP